MHGEIWPFWASSARACENWIVIYDAAPGTPTSLKAARGPCARVVSRARLRERWRLRREGRSARTAAPLVALLLRVSSAMPAAPFSQYASKFLNTSFMQPAASSTSTSQPLFYSFTDQSERDDIDRSRDLDDDDDPHLRRSDKATTLEHSEDDILNPFQDDAPLIPSEPRPQSGWMAHVHRAASPAQSMASSSSGSRSIEGPSDSFFSDPPARSNLRESLLPRDGISRSVFSLPDPRRVPLRKYNDPAWTVLYCACLCAVLVGSIVVFFVTRVCRVIPPPVATPLTVATA